MDGWRKFNHPFITCENSSSSSSSEEPKIHGPDIFTHTIPINQSINRYIDIVLLLAAMGVCVLSGFHHDDDDDDVF